MSHRWTKRPQNACRRCGYTWYPRGKDVSRSCPGCGSRDVELAIMALFRAVGTLLVLIAHCVKWLIELAAAGVVWLAKRLGGLFTAVLTWFSTRSRGHGTGSLSQPAPVSRSPLSTKHQPPASPVWANRKWCATRRTVAMFFAWIASVNDDITGLNENPSVLGVLAKLMAILTLAGTAFAVAVVACRSVGLL